MNFNNKTKTFILALVAATVNAVQLRNMNLWDDIDDAFEDTVDWVDGALNDVGDAIVQAGDTVVDGIVLAADAAALVTMPVPVVPSNPANLIEEENLILQVEEDLNVVNEDAVEVIDEVAAPVEQMEEAVIGEEAVLSEEAAALEAFGMDTSLLTAEEIASMWWEFALAGAFL